MNAFYESSLWVELAILAALLGGTTVSRLRDPFAAWRWGLIFTGGTLVLSMLAGVGFYLGRAAEIEDGLSLQMLCFGHRWLALDELSAPLVPLLALLHFLTAVATGRTKMRRFSLSLSLYSEAIGLALFSCQAPYAIVLLLCLGVIPAYLELRNRQQPRRLYAIHMILFVVLLVAGWWLSNGQRSQGMPADLAAVALLAAVLIRSGSIPAHCWVTDWFEHASLGSALLFVMPLTGVYAAVRLVVPIAPDWVLRGLGAVSLLTAVYAAGMASVQKEARRFFAFLFVSQAAIILIGLELHTPTSLTGSLALWISAALSLTGLGLTLRALEARYGRLSLTRFHGLYEHVPMLAVSFLLTGLATVGFPGTFGFVASELLIDGAVEANLLVGVTVTLVTAINGIAVLRAYFLLFTGMKHSSTISLGMSLRERVAVLTLAMLILGGGLVPQPFIVSRAEAGRRVLQERDLKSKVESRISKVKREVHGE